MGKKRRVQRARQSKDQAGGWDVNGLVQVTSLDADDYDEAVHRLVNTGAEPCRECGAETAPGCGCEDCADDRGEFAAFLEPGERVIGWHCRSCGNRWARGEAHFGEA